jgi:hypothetical protein
MKLGFPRWLKKILSHINPLLGNGSINTFLRTGNSGNSVLCLPCYNKLLGYTIILKTEEDVFYVVLAAAIQRYSQNTTKRSRVEAGSNTSTVALRVVGGDEKVSLESETVKYGRESKRTWTWEWLRWRGPAAITNDRPVLSSERTPHINKPATV